MKAFRRCLCPIGGNWIGETAKGDLNPHSTFKREIIEELALEKNIQPLLLSFNCWETCQRKIFIILLQMDAGQKKTKLKRWRTLKKNYRRKLYALW